MRFTALRQQADNHEQPDSDATLYFREMIWHDLIPGNLCPVTYFLLSALTTTTTTTTTATTTTATATATATATTTTYLHTCLTN